MSDGILFLSLHYMQMTRASYSPVISQPAGTCSWRDEISAFPGMVDFGYGWKSFETCKWQNCELER